MERTAHCQCGALRVIASGEPTQVYVCHCQACQRRTGAVVHAGTNFLKSQVRIEGQSKEYARAADSGRVVRFHFCPECGSNVYWYPERLPDAIGIAVGAFADPNFPAPTASLWEASKHPWINISGSVDHFAKSRT
jgi:hypothetical protein